ncbi:MAG: pyridoxal 5'-phosphate synthase glutaminase subunit PdxT [Armatimonadota bacterium]|nr:pyridoxal 5'-phosphate synthase glutaminase subunit PdxT [Armatimonadota bacterium]MDR5703843.1 pyridoxal 5'-phosphate synthase glutaminase subunit PdxT [Armatimonadota bacterium]MDR7434220.1 pyridoxal 5'-phosphate synthase glutaminase subunit PdxT [Armatimonadota bacterium]
MKRMVQIGVLALQGDVQEHMAMVEAAGGRAMEVRTPEALREVDGLIIPGGESTTIGGLMARYGLDEAIRERVRDGFPVFGTCAGLILMASEVDGGEPPLLRVMDVRVQRNAYGRQRESFEAKVEVPLLGADPLRVAFIRAPRIERVGPAVEVLATYQGRPVLVRQGNLLGATFHPEICGDPRVHEYFLLVITS